MADLLVDEYGDSTLDESLDGLDDELTTGTPVPTVQPKWKWVIAGTPPAGVERREMTAGYGRHITFRLDGISDAQFSMNGKNAEAAEVAELATDIVVYRTTQFGTVEKLFRGRISTETDDVTATGHFCQFSVSNYRGMLQNRYAKVPLAFVATDINTIVAAIVTAAQSGTGGDWGMTGPTTLMGAVHTITYDVGQNWLQALDDLGHRAAGGFEWDVDANLALNTYPAGRGSSTGAVIDYGGVLTEMHKTLRASDFGNVAILTGDNTTTTPVVVTSTSIGTDAAGRWERYTGYSDIKVQATLADRAAWQLGVTQVLRPVYTVVVAPGRWDREAMWLGDTVKFVARSGRLNVSGLFRIIEINVAINETGIETVQLGLILA